jgi:signal transduction histidine kinase/CheY-like chemotaxis protein
MAAAQFPADSICLAAPDGFNQNWLAIMVSMGTFAILTIALLTSIFDARLEARSQILALSQATAEERQTLLTRERAARTQAEHLSALKDEFLATLSHELRTPLNSILGWAQILRRGIKDEATLNKGLDTIERNARAQAQLIDDLLDMSRIISGKIRLDMQPIDPFTFVEAALETIQPAAITKNISLEKRLDPATGPISGDVNRLQQIMWNLLSNAVKFTPSGGIVRITLEKRAGNIEINVTDSGVGIDPDFLPEVFDRFRQADASTTRKYGGLGLGLSIVKNLVELHGGTVKANSPGVGQGATFRVVLPLMEKSVVSLTGNFSRSDSAAATSTDFVPVDLAGISILAVDDEADSLELIAQILMVCNATVYSATSALDALARFSEKKPDIVISDIGMPDMDGYDFIGQLRKSEAVTGRQTPVIALSAFTRSEDRQRALNAGFDDYMHKPVEPSSLVKRVADMARSAKQTMPAVKVI